MSENNVDAALSLWEHMLLHTVNQHAPQKRKRVKRKFQPEWFNEDIRSAIRNRDKAKIKEQDVYRFWRNKVTSLIRQAKRDYFKNAVAKRKGDTKEIWQILRSVQSSYDTAQSSEVNLLHVDGKDIGDVDDIANACNSFFTCLREVFYQGK